MTAVKNKISCLKCLLKIALCDKYVYRNRREKKSRQQEFIKRTAAQADNTKKGAEKDLFPVFAQHKLS